MSRETSPQTRPRAISVLVCLLLMSGAGMVLVQALWALGPHPSTPESEQYFFGFEFLELVISVALFAVVFVAAILIWRARRTALWFVLGSMVFAAASIGQRLLARDLHGLVYSFGLLGILVLVFWPVVVLVLSGFLLGHARRLNSQGTT